MKRLFLYLLILCVISTVQAQSTDYYNRMEHIFGAIDKSKVTTGYLKEFGVRLNRVESCNGTLDTTESSPKSCHD